MPTASASPDHAARHPIETLGRVGYAAKGVVYALLGVLALNAAFGAGDPEGRGGTLRAIAGTSYGPFLLWALVVGLAAYGLWRFALAVLDPKHEGDDAEGLLKRAGYVVSGVAYLTLAYTAFRVVTGAGGSGGAGGTEERAETVLGIPGGRWILAAVALGVIGYGVYQFVRAYRASFMDHFDLDGVAARNREWVRRAGRAGLSARGVVYVLIGTFLGQAALRGDSDEAGGLDAALAALQGQGYGPWLLALVALGLVLYGVYCGVNAAYREYEGEQ